MLNLEVQEVGDSSMFVDHGFSGRRLSKGPAVRIYSKPRVRVSLSRHLAIHIFLHLELSGL